METLAYLHHALDYENANSEVPAPGTLKLFGMNWKRLSTPAWTCFLSLVLTVSSSILGMAGQATAATKQGTKGPQVTAIQQQLRSRGYLSQRPTGNFGSATREAVIRFQRSRGLTPDGIVGPATEAALFGRTKQTSRQNANYSYRSTGYSNVLQLGNRGPEVKRLQEQLQQGEYYSGSIDGVFGLTTKQAVSEFQQARGGLTPDGVAGPQTLTALRNYTPRSYYSSTTSAPTSYYAPTTPAPTSYYAPTTPGTNSYLANSYPSSGPYIPSPSSTGLSLDNSRSQALQIGDQGPDVTRLQERLTDQNIYFGAVDGVFGPGTERAVRRFQMERNLPVDGVAGPGTLQALGLSSSNKKRYVVVVPIRSNDTLSQVQQYEPGAVPTASRLGSYINVGEYPDRLSAEAQSRSLRSHQLDARVVYR